MSRGGTPQRAGFGAGPQTVARVALALAAAILLTSSGRVAAKSSKVAPDEAPPPPAAWSMNLYNPSVVRVQNPDLNGCAAASVVSMLGIIAVTPTIDAPPPRGSTLPTSSFVWAVDTTYGSQKRVMYWERQHMTMYKGYKGSDPHGWRNALNYFGWGSIYAGVYRDTTYSTFAKAAKATVVALARTNKPVGILGWSGEHAQYVTGYSVQGEDPRVSDKFTIIGVFLSDPLREAGMPNAFITYKDWKSGPRGVFFTKYKEVGSVFPDPVDGQAGDLEWAHKWVLVEPMS